MTNVIQFQASEKYAFGKIAETQIALWLRCARGFTVLPIYEKEIDDGKGPRLFMPAGELVAPDMLVMKGGNIKWVEAKHKKVFSRYIIGGCWVTGIDLNHYQQYLRVADTYAWNVWLLFLHEQEKDGVHPYHAVTHPWPSPTGLYAGDIRSLRDRYSHMSDKWGRHGMIYWAEQTLRKVATLDEVQAATVSVLQRKAA